MSNFKLKRLRIQNYKNLKDLAINFCESKGITVLIGGNGCGKSNIIECIAMIFANLYDNKHCILNFDYDLSYEIDDKKVDLTYHKGQELTVKIDGAESSISSESLPQRVVALYNGESSRLYDAVFAKFNLNYWKAMRSSKEIPSIPMMYIEDKSLPISAVCLGLKNTEDFVDVSTFFKKSLQIKQIENISFRYDKAKTRSSQSSVSQILDNIVTVATTERGNDYSLSFDAFKDKVKDLDTLQLFDCFYFASANSAYQILSDIKVQVRLLDNEIVDLEELSEGEKKNLLLEFVMESLGDEHSLILLDEPDAHIHVSRKADIKDLLAKYEGKRCDIVTTHSPTLTCRFDREEIKGLGVDEEGNAIKVNDDKQYLLSEITDGMWNAQEQNLFLASNKPIILLVEGVTDRDHIKNAYEKLKDEYPQLDFDVFSMNGADSVQNAIVSLSSSDMKWDKTIIGIFDKDDKGKDKMKNGHPISGKDFQKTKKGENFFYMTIPVKEGFDDGHGYTIENCFDAERYLEAYEKAFKENKAEMMNLSINQFSDKVKNRSKTILAEMSKSFSKEDFSVFRKIFEMIMDIDKYRRNISQKKSKTI